MMVFNRCTSSVQAVRQHASPHHVCLIMAPTKQAVWKSGRQEVVRRSSKHVRRKREEDLGDPRPPSVCTCTLAHMAETTPTPPISSRPDLNPLAWARRWSGRTVSYATLREQMRSWFELSRPAYRPRPNSSPTAYAQPALLTTSIAATQPSRPNRNSPRCFAGHSLGEYNARSRGCLDFAAAVRLTRAL